jgi:hypothetical protein
MRFTFLLYSDFSKTPPMTEAEMEREHQVYGAYIGALQKAGVFVHTDWLQPAATATAVSSKRMVRGVLTRALSPKTRETLGGLVVVDVPNLDAALSWAAKCPAAQYGKVEVRSSAMP